MHILDEKTHAAANGHQSDVIAQRQQRRMQVALGLLVVALLIVLYRDRQLFLASSNPQPESVAQSVKASTGQPLATLSASKQPVSLQRSKPNIKTPPATKDEPAPFITTSDRAVLPPLEVEVVAGDQHRKVATRNPSIRLDLQSGDPRSAQNDTPESPSELADAPPAWPGGNVSVSAEAAKVVSHPVQPNYPVLARQMKVQGAVVMRALIDKAGHIENLQVLSGPSMLATAAREAVKQWHFKPLLQAGQPVETETRITVNFTISTI
jgi:TonB family protein